MKLTHAAVAVLALFLIAAGGGSASPAKRTALATRGQVLFLSADAGRVAVATAGVPNACDRVAVWRPAKHRSSNWATHTNCPGGATSGGQQLRELALAGPRVAWLEAVAGNAQDLTLWSATVGSKKLTRLAFAENHNGAEGSPEGDYVGNVHGDRALIAYNTWTICPRPLPDGAAIPPCPPAVSSQTLWTSSGGKQTAVRRNPDTIAVVAVDGPRIAVRNSSGTVRIFSAAGQPLEDVAVLPGTIDGLALSGSQLAVLRDGAIEVYSIVTGLLVKRITLPPATAPRLTDLQTGLAAYVAGRQVRVVRVVDGKNVVAAVARTPVVDAQLEAPGLSYGYNVSGRTRGRVVFVPMAAVRRKLG